MPYRFVEPDVAFEHGGVTVYHCYYGGTDEPMKFHFTTVASEADDCGGNRSFDVRQIVGAPWSPEWNGVPNVKQWHDWWCARFPSEGDAIEAIITAAIDRGRIVKP